MAGSSAHLDALEMGRRQAVERELESLPAVSDKSIMESLGG